MLALDSEEQLRASFPFPSGATGLCNRNSSVIDRCCASDDDDRRHGRWGISRDDLGSSAAPDHRDDTDDSLLATAEAAISTLQGLVSRNSIMSGGARRWWKRMATVYLGTLWKL